MLWYPSNLIVTLKHSVSEICSIVWFSQKAYGDTAYLSLRPGFENSCNKDPNGLRIAAGIIWDVTVCRWVSVSRRREWKGCFHLLSSCGQRTISYINLFTSTPSTAIPETYCLLHASKNTNVTLKHDELLSAALSWFGQGSSQWQGFSVHGYETFGLHKMRVISWRHDPMLDLNKIKNYGIKTLTTVLCHSKLIFPSRHSNHINYRRYKTLSSLVFSKTVYISMGSRINKRKFWLY
jgi:hypothetical protein